MILVTDAMIEAAIARLNEIAAADPARDTVRLPWEDVLREAYIAMERQRLAVLDAPRTLQ